METNQQLVEDMKKLVSDVLMRSRYAKEELCKEEPMTDNPPIFFVGYASDEGNPEHEACLEAQEELSLSVPYQMGMVPLIHQADPYDAYQDIVRTLPIEKFDFLVLALEGYTRDAKSEDEAHDYSHGDLEKEYKENPFSNVRETLTITAVDWNLESFISVRACYRYDDNGVPMWDEPLVSEVEEPEDNMGRFGNALIDTVKFMHLATKTLAYKNILDKAPRNKKDESGE